MAEGEKDHYETLGARHDSTRDEIGRRYKRLASERHPDRGGSEEAMKDLNEAYRVLGDDAAREAYDSRRRAARSSQGDDIAAGKTYAENFAPEEFTPVSSSAAQADAMWGRAAGATLCVFLGLVLLMLVRAHYVVFLFPLALLAAALVFFGVWMAHAAMVYAREGFQPSHFARRSAWAQELIFWSVVAGGVGVVYLLLTSV
ncbi:MAG: J domain-containing protein [Acidobacteria bacterium]|nr:J domain-containing protein [Acidobacteriota bacterium]MCA1640470.1 J domain-containing protein [Acidobacteriota bacterium]